jgi:hypothetical protein
MAWHGMDEGSNGMVCRQRERGRERERERGTNINKQKIVMKA